VRQSSADVTCYDYTLADDGKGDCLGEIDERRGGFCSRAYPMEKDRRFHCQNSDVCLNPEQLCNGQFDCPEQDDEVLLCNWMEDFSTSLPVSSSMFACFQGFTLTSGKRCDIE
jgi:hypothetical protein